MRPVSRRSKACGSAAVAATSLSVGYLPLWTGRHAQLWSGRNASLSKGRHAPLWKRRHARLWSGSCALSWRHAPPSAGRSAPLWAGRRAQLRGGGASWSRRAQPRQAVVRSPSRASDCADRCAAGPGAPRSLGAKVRGEIPRRRSPPAPPWAAQSRQGRLRRSPPRAAPPIGVAARCPALAPGRWQAQALVPLLVWAWPVVALSSRASDCVGRCDAGLPRCSRQRAQRLRKTLRGASRDGQQVEKTRELPQAC